MLFLEIAIIGGYNGNFIHDVEIISIHQDSISHIDSSIPSLPKEYWGLGGAQLPNGDLVVCGGQTGEYIQDDCFSEYLYYKEGSNQWKKVGTMKPERTHHSSVWNDGRLLTTGGERYLNGPISHHEEFSFDGKRGWRMEFDGVKERKEMPIALYKHTTTILDQNRMIVSGGKIKSCVSKNVF